MKISELRSINLSENLTLYEGVKSTEALRLGIDNTPSEDILEVMKFTSENLFQVIRNYFKTPVYINSFYRNPLLNKKIGGSRTSQHVKGEAIDIDMDNHNSNLTNCKIFIFIKCVLSFDQLIWEYGTQSNPAWVHVSKKYKGVNRGQILIATKHAARYVNYSKENRIKYLPKK